MNRRSFLFGSAAIPAALSVGQSSSIDLLARTVHVPPVEQWAYANIIEAWISAAKIKSVEESMIVMSVLGRPQLGIKNHKQHRLYNMADIAQTICLRQIGDLLRIRKPDDPEHEARRIRTLSLFGASIIHPEFEQKQMKWHGKVYITSQEAQRIHTSAVQNFYILMKADWPDKVA